MYGTICDYLFVAYISAWWFIMEDLVFQMNVLICFTRSVWSYHQSNKFSCCDFTFLYSMTQYLTKMKCNQQNCYYYTVGIEKITNVSCLNFNCFLMAATLNRYPSKQYYLDIRLRMKAASHSRPEVPWWDNIFFNIKGFNNLVPRNWSAAFNVLHIDWLKPSVLIHRL